MENLHIYVCGKSGFGKSTFLKNEIFGEITNRDRAIVFIDPHGHDAYDLLDVLPRQDFKRTVIMDFADPNFIVSFNPLAAGAVHTLSGLKSIWLESWGPRMNNILRYALLVLEQNPSTVLTDIIPLLHDERYRAQLLTKVTQPAGKKFLKHGGEFDKEYRNARDHPLSPILNKIGEIAASDISRFLCDRQPTIGFERILAEKLILIVNLSKPTLGDEAAAIAGSLITTTLRAALLRRPAPCSLYADEFQTYGTSLFASMLSEMRKFGLKMVLAHQFISQIHPSLQKAILGNVNHKVIFNVDYDDAVVLGNAYNRPHESFNPNALIELQPYTALYDGVLSELPAFDQPRGKLHDARLTSRRFFARQL